MASQPIRDPRADHLLTPQNAALIIIDYQPLQVSSVKSMDGGLLVKNIVRVAKTAKVFGVPIILSTVNVKTGLNKPTIAELQEVLPGVTTYDRTSINAWEDEEFVTAVRATGRRKLLMTALWTEACLSFPSLDALAEGFDVYPVVDAVGGTSAEAHRAALERVVQAGCKPLGWVGLICELQRDWLRHETIEAVRAILFS